MPEGHTLRRLANDLDAAFGGGPVRVSSPQGRFAADAALVDGQPVLGADSAGKHLFVEFPGERFIHIHLGLIGKFDIFPAPVSAPVGQVRLRLQNETAYADLRGAILCNLIGRAKRDQVVCSLGPDPLRPDADPMTAWARIGKSHRPIGDLLMDQLVAVGATLVFSGVVSFVLAKVVDATIGLRVSPDDEAAGLDTTQHAETAYNLGDFGSMGRIGA